MLAILPPITYYAWKPKTGNLLKFFLTIPFSITGNDVFIGGKIFLELLAVLYYTDFVGKERREVCRKSIEGDQRQTTLRLCVLMYV